MDREIESMEIAHENGRHGEERTKRDPFWRKHCPVCRAEDEAVLAG